MKFIQKNASYDVVEDYESGLINYSNQVVGEVYLDVSDGRYYFRPAYTLKVSYGLTILSRVVAFIAQLETAGDDR